MKSLLLTYDYPPTIGGIANILATFMRIAGDSACVILAPGSSGARAFDAEHPVRTIRFPTIFRLGAVGKGVSFILGSLWTGFWLCRHRPEVVMAGQVVRAGPITYLWHRISGKPYYVWVYGGETSSRFLPSRRLTRFLHRILRQSRVVFTNSPFTTAEMRDFGLGSVVEIPRGVDHDVFYPTPKEAAYVERFSLGGKLVFLTLGRLIERKGVDRMLEALSRLNTRLPPWHYLVVSDGPYREHLEKLTDRLGLREKVTFTGYIERRELPIYYNLCDIFSMPNREVAGDGKGALSVEGFGTVFVEAAACAKPVIAGRSGGAVYALQDGVNGLVVEPDDVGDICGAILHLADNDVRDEMGANGVEFAAKFDWESSGEILRQYLRNVY
jgi:phosphatidylinositol alpha-1,6-mannosyltransferase